MYADDRKHHRWTVTNILDSSRTRTNISSGRMVTVHEGISGKNVLLTGAGGSIGSALARAVTALGPRLLILLEHSERCLFELDASLGGLQSSVECLPVVGDIGDRALLRETFERYKIEVILHTAALKHVPLMELNPIAAVRTNALGTNTLAKVAAMFGTPNFVMVSTDKAVNPRSIMGASKRVGELALVRWANEQSRMRSIRLGNVLSSQGSVVPTFERQIAEGGPVTVTHPDASRYFLTMEKAVDLILASLSIEGKASVLIPELEGPMKIIDLAHKVIKASGFEPETEIPITLIGLRPGDKMSENFVAERESIEATSDPKLFAVNSPQIPSQRFDALMGELTDSSNQRDLARVLESLCQIAPEYQPGEALHRRLKVSSPMQI